MAELDKNKILKQVGNRIKTLRLQQNLSLEQLAFEIKTSERIIRSIEAAEINTSVYKLFQIADALNLRPDELLNFNDNSRNTDVQAISQSKKVVKKKPTSKEATKKK